MTLSAHEIASRLDFVRSGAGWRGRCPACGYPSAGLLSKKGHLRCVSCEDAAGLQKVLDDLGVGILPPRHADPDKGLPRDEKIRRALVIWNGAGLAVDTPAAFYLANRGLPALAISPVIRYRRDVPHPNSDVRARIPAMVGIISDVNDAPIAVHRTFVTLDGQKANVDPPKAAKGPLWGGAIRLDPVAEEIVIGEGIETSASAGRLLNLPAWAAVSAGNLAQGLQLPPEVRSVVVAADADEPGEQAARRAALRWSREGRQVRIARPVRGNDFNDLLIGAV